MGHDVILLDFWASPFGARVRVALGEKEVEYEYREEDLKNKSDLLLTMNPVHKKVPVLVHLNKSVCESSIIVEYIDEFWHSRSPLLPFDPYQKAQARFWANYIDNKIYDATKKVWTTKGREQEEGKKEFIEHLKVLEHQLGDKPYFGGDSFGYVDVTLIPFYSWFYALETIGNFKIKESNPKIIQWAQRCMQRKSVANALHDEKKVYGFVLELKKTHGIE